MLTGKTPFFAYTLDPRFSFGLYIPPAHSFEPTAPRLPLLVVVHGTRRQTGGTLTRLAPFADKHGLAVLMPLFPAGIIDPYDVHNYKHILYRGIRFDEVLLGMVAQAGGVWRVETERFWLHGFSGGGQFAHRFLYLHSQRLHGVSIGAPGGITHPGVQHGKWPAGLEDVEEVFGIKVDFEEMARVKVQLVVGEKDTDGSALGKDDKAGTNRVERVRYLQGALEEIGVSSELTVVGGVGHDGVKCLPTVEGWLNNKFSENK
ncbi:poly hydrolase [Mycena olivaceomarginata]|nr:poly hydrolase [Mycena olivaceomarginata]